MLKGFRDFIMRGNVIELAVAVAIGTAFTAVVTQFGSSFIKPWSRSSPAVARLAARSRCADSGSTTAPSSTRSSSS